MHNIDTISHRKQGALICLGFHFQPISDRIGENELDWLVGNVPGTNERLLLSTEIYADIDTISWNLLWFESLYSVRILQYSWLLPMILSVTLIIIVILAECGFCMTESKIQTAIFVSFFLNKLWPNGLSEKTCR